MLFQKYIKAHPVTDADAKAEYDKIKAEQSGIEYHARHILVDSEDEAKKLIAQIKAGAKFEDLAKKNSKDTGSAENGGDLDWAKPATYVPEFSTALQGLKKGEMTDTPVKTQFGYHIIRWKTRAPRSSRRTTKSRTRSSSRWNRSSCRNTRRSCARPRRPTTSSLTNSRSKRRPPPPSSDASRAPERESARLRRRALFLCSRRISLGVRSCSATVSGLANLQDLTRCET